MFEFATAQTTKGVSSRDKFLRISVSEVSGLVSVSKATGLGYSLLSWDCEYPKEMA